MTGARQEPMPLPEEVRRIAERLIEAGYDTWCVGGAVRDWRMGLKDNDVDLATAAPPDEVQRLFRRTVAVGVKYGTVGVLDPVGGLHEVTTFRKDVSTDGRHAVVEFGVSIDEDLQRRDFTINALAYHPIREELRDPHCGGQDIEAGVIRAVGLPARRFAEDYLRILRMIRFAARFDFQIDPATWEAAVAAAPGLAGLSAERVREEWYKGLGSVDQPERLLTLWRETGAAAHWLPELVNAYPFAAALPRPSDPVVVTVGLTSNPVAVLKRLKASNEEIGRARAMMAAVQEPAADDPVVVRRWLSLRGNAVDDLMQLARYRLGRAPAWSTTVAGIRERDEPTSRGQLALSGDDLRAVGVAAGPELGRILERLLDTVLEDPSRNQREALLALVRSWQ